MGGKQPVLTLFCKQIDDKRLDSGYVVFNDVLDAWLSETRGRVKRSTLATYRGASERYVRPALGALPTEQMTDEQVAKFLREASEIYASSTLRIICHILGHRARARLRTVRRGQRTVSASPFHAARGAHTQPGRTAASPRDAPSRRWSRAARDTALPVHGYASGGGLRPALGRLLT